MPSWEFTGFGHTIPFEVFLPAVLFPGLTFTLFYAWPFVESRVTGNRHAHNLLERPRNRPLHTAVGAMGLAFYFMLFAASSTDVLANFTQISLNTVLWFFRFAIFNGFLGYSLPDDLVSGTGIRISFSIVESIPLIGSYMAFFLFGGNFPGDSIIPRFFTLHVLVLPAVIVGLLSAHLGMLVRQKHTQFPGPGRTKHNVVGAPLWPTFVAKTTGFMFLVVAACGALSALFQINPIWLYGPYVPYRVTYAVQPDWYMGWLDGALRIMPSWEITGFGHMIPNAFFPAILLPGITFGVLQAWPFIEAKLTGDHGDHQVLDRPRDRPKRTALGAAVFALYFVLFGASATDVLANYLSISLNVVLVSFRFLVVIVPLIVYPVTYRICLELQRVPSAGQRKRSNVILRSTEGGYSTVPSEVRPGDVAPRIEPLPLDEDVELVPVPAGVLAVAGGSGVDAGPVDGEAAESPRARKRGDGPLGGIFTIPRDYR